MKHKRRTTNLLTVALLLLMALLLLAMPQVIGVSRARPNPTVTPTPSKEASPLPRTLDEAAQIASELISHEARVGRMPVWSGATIDEPMTYLDLNQEPVAYAFSVVRDSQDVGYVVIGVRTYPHAVLEWSSSSARHLAGIQNCEHIASDLDLTLLNGRFFYLGALSYYCIAASESTVQQLSDGKPPTGQVVLIDMNDSRTVFLSPEEFTESTSTEPLPFSESVNSVNQDNLLALDAILGFKQLDVPTYYQHCYGGCYVGCGPTAAGTLMGYWSSRGYPNLMSGGSQAVIERLHDLAGTWCDGPPSVCGDAGYGYTNWNDIDEAMEDFVSERGYTGQSSYIHWPTFAQYKGEIDADRPLVLGLMGHGDWGDHIVTGAGYSDDSGQYMIVNPNLSGWGATWIQYGQGYSSIGMDTLALSGGPPPCPPEDCTPGNEVGRDFFVQVVERLADVPVSDFAVDALVIWEPYENTLACWNPLATTWYMEGSCDFNAVGVKHYLTCIPHFVERVIRARPMWHS